MKNVKGIVLAGGMGTRLYPLTKVSNKHTLPVYDRPMIYYPIQSLVKAGINDIILVTGGNHMSQFIDLLGDGSDLGCRLTYVVQQKPGGIAEAISLTQNLVDDKLVVILGDNIFQDDIKPYVDEFLDSTKRRRTGDFFSKCHVVCTEVPGHEAVNYGVLSHGGGIRKDEQEDKDIEEIQKENGQVYITEKPNFVLKYPERMFKVVTGLYMYTYDVFGKITKLKPSARGELEVSDLNDMYAARGNLTYSVTKGLWLDAGVSIDNMLECSLAVKNSKLCITN